MQLHTARLCLDCQEIHEGQTCPVCGSESFAYISRWIPAPERRAKPRPAPDSPEAETYRRLLSPERNQPVASRWLKRGAFGLAAVSAAAWMLKRNADTEKTAPDESGKPPSGGNGGDTRSIADDTGGDRHEPARMIGDARKRGKKGIKD